MKHTTDGTGNFILSWKWEFQHLHQRMGWTYWLLFSKEEDAQEFLDSYVKKGFPNDKTQIVPYLGEESYFILAHDTVMVFAKEIMETHHKVFERLAKYDTETN